MPTQEPSEIDVHKLALEPGDILVIEIADNLDPSHVHEIFDQAMRRAHVHAPVVIGRKGDLSMTVVKASPSPPDLRELKK